MNIPQALGYTRIAGTPVVTGLYTLLLPLVAFAAFGSSRYLVVAADSATAAILAGGLSKMAPVASEHYVALAGLVALLTAGCLLLARLFKLGFLADFLSQTVLVGFLTGVGFQVGIAMLGEMLGVPVDANRTLEQLAQVVRGLPQVHLPTLCVSAAVVTIVLVFRSAAPAAARPALRGRRGDRGERRVRLLRPRHHPHPAGSRRPAADRPSGCRLGELRRCSPWRRRAF